MTLSFSDANKLRNLLTFLILCSQFNEKERTFSGLPVTYVIRHTHKKHFTLYNYHHRASSPHLWHEVIHTEGVKPVNNNLEQSASVYM